MPFLADYSMGQAPLAPAAQAPATPCGQVPTTAGPTACVPATADQGASAGALLFRATTPLLDLTADKRLDAACAAVGTRISRVFFSTVSEALATRAVDSRGSLNVEDNPPARIDRRGTSQMSPRDAKFAPVVTPEQLMASLESLDANLGEAAGHHTPLALHHLASPGLSPSDLQPLNAHHEPP